MSTPTVYISVTTIPERAKTVIRTIWSLAQQSYPGLAGIVLIVPTVNMRGYAWKNVDEDVDTLYRTEFAKIPTTVPITVVRPAYDLGPIMKYTGMVCNVPSVVEPLLSGRASLPLRGWGHKKHEGLHVSKDAPQRYYEYTCNTGGGDGARPWSQTLALAEASKLKSGAGSPTAPTPLVFVCDDDRLYAPTRVQDIVSVWLSVPEKDRPQTVVTHIYQLAALHPRMCALSGFRGVLLPFSAILCVAHAAAYAHPTSKCCAENDDIMAGIMLKDGGYHVVTDNSTEFMNTEQENRFETEVRAHGALWPTGSAVANADLAALYKTTRRQYGTVMCHIAYNQPFAVYVLAIGVCTACLVLAGIGLGIWGGVTAAKQRQLTRNAQSGRVRPRSLARNSRVQKQSSAT